MRSGIVSTHLKEHFFGLLCAGLLQQLKHQGLANTLAAGLLTDGNGLNVTLFATRNLADARVAKQLLGFTGSDRN